VHVGHVAPYATRRPASGQGSGSLLAHSTLSRASALKHRRGEARRLRAGARMAADAATDRRGSATALDARLLFPRVADAIDALPDGERDALLLFAWEDLSYQSMAEALELPIGTVRSRLNRAPTQLRELLEPGGKKGRGRDESGGPG
jgi:RNA polymerase sigma factor (sigma-70 family)